MNNIKQIDALQEEKIKIIKMYYYLRSFQKVWYTNQKTKI